MYDTAQQVIIQRANMSLTEKNKQKKIIGKKSNKVCENIFAFAQLRNFSYPTWNVKMMK